MDILVIVKTAPYQCQGPDSAWHFIQAALEVGHAVPCVFFYQDGVYNANRSSISPRDDRDIVFRWSRLAEQQRIPLLLCNESAIRRGIMDKAEARRHGQDDHTLAEGFTPSSLTRLVDYAIAADRVISF